MRDDEDEAAMRGNPHYRSVTAQCDPQCEPTLPQMCMIHGGVAYVANMKLPMRVNPPLPFTDRAVCSTLPCMIHGEGVAHVAYQDSRGALLFVRT